MSTCTAVFEFLADCKRKHRQANITGPLFTLIIKEPIHVHYREIKLEPGRSINDLGSKQIWQTTSGIVIAQVKAKHAAPPLFLGHQ